MNTYYIYTMHILITGNGQQRTCMYELDAWSQSLHISLKGCPHLSTQGGGEAAVEGQEAFALHHMRGHPHHPQLHLLLSLQVNLRRKRGGEKGTKV
jgi:hypothetical protein